MYAARFNAFQKSFFAGGCMCLDVPTLLHTCGATINAYMVYMRAECVQYTRMKDVQAIARVSYVRQVYAYPPAYA